MVKILSGLKAGDKVKAQRMENDPSSRGGRGSIWID
jgi:hypothetical protein